MGNQKQEKDKSKPLDNFNRVIHEPARLLILAYLYAVESADFLFLMSQTGLTKGNLSSHISKLESIGYVEVNKEFVKKIPRTLLRLTDNGRNAFKEYKDSMHQVLNHTPG